MRYLSQLTRETTARVAPSRQPSWLRPVGILVQESISAPISRIASPADSTRPPVSGQAPVTTAKASAKEFHTEVRSKSGSNSAKVISEPAAAIVSPKVARAERHELSSVRPTLAVHDKLPSETEYFREVEFLEPSIAPQTKHSEVTAVRKAPTAPTLQSIIAEIARRQQELDQQHKEDQASRASQSARSANGLAEKTSDKKSAGKDDIHLNIGSILVQVESEPAPHAVAQPQPYRRQLPPARHGANNDRWARSFLDR